MFAMSSGLGEVGEGPGEPCAKSKLKFSKMKQFLVCASCSCELQLGELREVSAHAMDRSALC